MILVIKIEMKINYLVIVLNLDLCLEKYTNFMLQSHHLNQIMPNSEFYLQPHLFFSTSSGRIDIRDSVKTRF